MDEFNYDWRNRRNGRVIAQAEYVDQPYLLKADDGAWLCCYTVSNGREGAAGQHIETRRSLDRGRSWSQPVPVEPGDQRENSYAVMLKAPGGRIFIFYNHNGDNVREILTHDRKSSYQRVDSLGNFVFKFSDDHGCSWSEKHCQIPVREFLCDRNNVYQGKLRFFWNVGKPFVRGNSAYVTLHKVGQMGRGFFQQSEGVLLASKNLLSEPDQEKILWETFPDGEVGLGTPPGGSSIAEEQNGVVLSDGSICVSYRSCDGYPVECYSRDGGHHWDPPRYKCFADGRKMKNPRADNVVWKCSNGKYLYWFHNHGGHFIREMWEMDAVDNPDTRSPYSDRNPAWICGGVEIDSPDGKIIQWGEPQILLYDDNPLVRMSYPDFFEDAGEYYLSETQKCTAMLHQIPRHFIERLWAPQPEKLILQAQGGSLVNIKKLPRFYQPDTNSCDYCGRSTGKRLLFRFLPSDCRQGIWIEALNQHNLGFQIELTKEQRLTLRWREPDQNICVESEILPLQFKQLELEIDSAPGILLFRCDGRFCDGGEERQFGWQRYPTTMQFLNWNHVMHIKSALHTVEIYEKEV